MGLAPEKVWAGGALLSSLVLTVGLALKRVRSGSVVVLDVRPREEYRAGHIAGALSIPVDELPRRLRDLPSRKEIVAYCRGPYCVLSIQAVEFLNQKGFHALRLEEGVQDWRAMGLPVASGE